MNLPFTPEQFFHVFAEYNERFVPVAAILWLVTLGLLIATWNRPQAYSRLLTLFIAAIWFWNAVAYHAILFTTINPAAWLFAGMFAAEGILLLVAGVRDRIRYCAATPMRRVAGVSLVIYAVAYPWLTMAAGHRYPATPTFGVPCPTDLLTIGLLLTVHGGAPRRLTVIPIAWGLIGGSAAILLDVITDYALLAAAVALLGSLSLSRRPFRRIDPRHSRTAR